MSDINSEVVADIQRLLNRDHGAQLVVDGDFGSPTFWDDGKTTNAILGALIKAGGPLVDKAPTPEPAPLSTNRKVFIEIGHGQLPRGYDPGAVRAPGGPNEHYLNKITAQAMHVRLGELGVQSFVSDPKVTNYASGQKAAGYDVAISVHHNSHTDGSSAQGAEALSDPRTRNPKSDARLCSILSARMAKANGIKDRGAKQARLSVLSGFRSVGVPYSALIEAFFVQRRPDDNPATCDMEVWSRKAGIEAAEGVFEFLQTV